MVENAFPLRLCPFFPQGYYSPRKAFEVLAKRQIVNANSGRKRQKKYFYAVYGVMFPISKASFRKIQEIEQTALPTKLHSFVRD